MVIGRRTEVRPGMITSPVAFGEHLVSKRGRKGGRRGGRREEGKILFCSFFVSVNQNFMQASVDHSSPAQLSVHRLSTLRIHLSNLSGFVHKKSYFLKEKKSN
jgi:hypothetical protein